MLNMLPDATAESLESKNNQELISFFGCYSHLTGHQPRPDNPLLEKVKTNHISGIEACFQIIDELRLEKNGRIGGSLKQTHTDMLQNFHRLHSSWFTNTSISTALTAGSCIGRPAEEVYDATVPALYFTRILTDDTFTFENLLTGKHRLRAIRSKNPGAKGVIHNITRTIITDKNKGKINPVFQMAGPILGVGKQPTFKVVPPRNDLHDEPVGTHMGGGLLGDPTYLMLNLGKRNYRTNGDMKVYRLYSKAVISDLLCRDLPVLRITDANEMVMKPPHASFKQINGCVQCHATMDPLAGLVRNQFLSFSRGGACTTNDRQLALVRRFKTTKGNMDTWKEKPNGSYFQSNPQATIHYRSYNGKLVDVKVNGFEEAGKALLEQDDVYMCVAKRYYQHFTGIGVDLSDINDPLTPVELTPEQLRHRKVVVGLGTRFKKHKDVRRVIKDIMLLPEYKFSPLYHRGPAGMSGGGQ